MLYIPKTSNSYFYDNCRYVQVQVFYNLPYVSNYTFNKLQDNVANGDYKLYFMPMYRKKCGKIFETISISNIHLISSIYLYRPNLVHIIYKTLLKKYYQNCMTTTISVLKSNIIHLLYASELLGSNHYGYFVVDLIKCIEYIVASICKLICLVLCTLTYLWINVQMLIHDTYVSYCRYILFIIYKNNNGRHISCLSDPSNSNKDLL